MFGRRTRRIEESIQFLAGVVEGYRSDFLQLQQALRDAEDGLSRERWRLDELMRILEVEVPNLVIPGHIEGPRLTTLGEGLSIIEEERILRGESPRERGLGCAPRTDQVEGGKIPVPPTGGGAPGDGPA